MTNATRLNRRNLLFAGGLGAGALGLGVLAGRALERRAVSGVSPWHLWGGEQNFSVSNTTGSQQTLQIAKVGYKRPDTWSLLAWCKIASIVGAAATDVKINVIFRVFMGVGRTMIDFSGGPSGATGPFGVPPGLLNFQFPIGAVAGAACWADAGQSQGQVAADFNTAIVQPISFFPAEDIQISATVAAIIVSAYTVQISAGAILAPRSHIRPDWFHSHFNGGELGGR